MLSALITGVRRAVPYVDGQVRPLPSDNQVPQRAGGEDTAAARQAEHAAGSRCTNCVSRVCAPLLRVVSQVVEPLLEQHSHHLFRLVHVAPFPVGVQVRVTRPLQSSAPSHSTRLPGHRRTPARAATQRAWPPLPAPALRLFAAVDVPPPAQRAPRCVRSRRLCGAGARAPAPACARSR